MQSQLAEMLTTAGTKISEAEFSTILKTLQTTSGDLNGLLCQAGFGSETISDWLNGRSLPSASFRAPLLHMFVMAALDHYMTVSPLLELQQMVGERGRDASSQFVRRGDSILDQRLDTLDFLPRLGKYASNYIAREEFVMLGELLAKSKQEVLRTPGAGDATLNGLNKVLMERFGVVIGSLSRSESEHYQQITYNRNCLQGAAGKPLPSRWDSAELKPEFKGLNWDALRPKVTQGVEIYVQVHADPDLLEKLGQLGILYKTQLATAPLSVIDRLCHGHEGWREQLLAMLNGTGLTFGTQVPPFMDPNVEVYQESGT